ncbi:MAG: hypothetical protein ACR2F1_11710 [Nitrososphaeraceae archaeon]
MNKTILFGIILSTTLMLSSVVAGLNVYGQQEQEQDDDTRIEGYDIYKEKMLPKCLEFKEADSLDMLKNYDTQLWLMCLDFIADDLK